jgi:drug/metabolite transporter (DMT)-like permease
VLRDALWPPQVSVGALVVVAGAFAWGIGTVVAARGVRDTGSPLALGAWQMIAGAVMLAVVSAVAEDAPSAAGPSTVGLVLVLAAVGSAMPIALFYVALSRAPAGEVSAWFFLVPVVGVLTAWPLLGETPGAVLVVGLVTISVGLWLVLRGPARRRLVPSRDPHEPAPLA